jgi:6,7-dimethyl-8-ribityllumazine synthase
VSAEQGPGDSGIERQARQVLRDFGDLPVPSDASGQRFAIVVGRFYEDLAERLVQGAQAAFSEAGATTVEIFDVPGAFELPLAARYAADSGRFRGVACLGAVIRGETDHYDFVCSEAARGIMQAQLDTGVPCAFGVLTCATMEQALARAGGGKRDQGRHAAEAVLRMAALREELRAGASNSLEGGAAG